MADLEENGEMEASAAVVCAAGYHDVSDQYVEGVSEYMLINENGCYYNRIRWDGAQYCLTNGHQILPDDGRPLWSGCDCSDPYNNDPNCFPPPPPPEEPPVE